MSTDRSRAPLLPGTAAVGGAHPLWGLVLVLADIARRVARHRDEESIEQPRVTLTTGSEPVVDGEGEA